MRGRTTAIAGIVALFCATAIRVEAQQALSLAAKPTSGPAPLSVTFTVSPVPASDSAIDFGDGSAASQLRPMGPSTAAVTHVYQANGRYVARLSAGPNVVASATVSVGQ